MASRPEPGGEELGGHNESRTIGSKVGKEEGERIHDNEPCVVVVLPMIVGDGEAQHEDSHEEEPLELDGEPADAVNERHCDPVAWHG